MKSTENIFLWFMVLLASSVALLSASCGTCDDDSDDDEDNAGDDDDADDEDDTGPADDTEPMDDTESADDTEHVDDTELADDTTDCDDDTALEWTWTDPDSGLMWQDGPKVGCLFHTHGYTSYICNHLEWGGYDDWYLPTISQLRSLIRGCEASETGGICGVTDDCLPSWCAYNCEPCDPYAGPGPYGLYWPSDLSGNDFGYLSDSPVTDYMDDDDEAYWYIGFDIAGFYNSYDTSPDGKSYRCVRDGP